MTRVRVVILVVTAAVAVGAASLAVPDVRSQGPSPDTDGDGFADSVDCAPTIPMIHPDAVDVPGNGLDENCSGKDAFPFVTPPVSASFTWHGNKTRVQRIAVSDVRPGALVFLGCAGGGCPESRPTYRSPGNRTRDVVIRKPYGNRSLTVGRAKLTILVSPPSEQPPYALTQFVPRRNRAPRRLGGCTNQITVDPPRSRRCSLLSVLAQFVVRDGDVIARRMSIENPPFKSEVTIRCFFRPGCRFFGDVGRLGPRRIDFTRQLAGTRIPPRSELRVVIVLHDRDEAGAALLTRWRVSRGGKIHRVDDCVSRRRVVSCPY